MTDLKQGGWVIIKDGFYSEFGFVRNEKGLVVIFSTKGEADKYAAERFGSWVVFPLAETNCRTYIVTEERFNSIRKRTPEELALITGMQRN